MNARTWRLRTGLALSASLLCGLLPLSQARGQNLPADFQPVSIQAAVVGDVQVIGYLSRVPAGRPSPTGKAAASTPQANGPEPKAGVSDAKANPPEPVVIALHGCGGVWAPKGGMSKRYTAYRDWFHQRGFNFLVLDSFTPRGLNKGVCTLHAKDHQAGPAQRRRDVELAMNWLAHQDWADAHKVLLLGWSHGGSTVLETMNIKKGWIASAPEPKAAIAFYPGCERVRSGGEYQLDVPLLLMIGEADDWTPARPCADFHEQQTAALRSAGKDPASFQYKSYPGAYHGFDSSNPLRVRHDVPRRNNAGVTSGGHPASHRDALSTIDAFLNRHFSGDAAKAPPEAANRSAG